MRQSRIAMRVLAGTLLAALARAEPAHDHPVPEHLGRAHFATSCPSVQSGFVRLLQDALLLVRALSGG